jgi:hypothetical protein
MRKLFIILFFLLTVLQIYAQQTPIHPRGVITQKDVSEIRKKTQKEPFRSWVEIMRTSTLSAEMEINVADPYSISYLALKQAQMYIVTGEQEWAEKSFQTLKHVIHDTVYFNDPVSRGLTRATQLFCAAQCYDFCYNSWTQDQRKEVNEKLFQTILTVNSNMGFSANYALESNWNGVRWGSALLAALVYDDMEGRSGKNPALPFVWDIQKRLKDHISANIFPGGWSAESISYHVYNWSFIAPALAALQNSSGNPVFSLETYAPHALRTIWGWSTSTVSIQHPSGKGIQPDLSDDDPQANYMLTALAFRLYPEEQIPAIKWMHDYLIDINQTDDDRGYLFYSVCWYPQRIPAENPLKQGWLTFNDESYGVSIWRNRFLDENDVVVAFNAPLKRVSGHKGPDNLSFRVIGNGNIWVTGAGRTGEIAGQTNLFPNTPAPNEKEPKDAVESLNFITWEKENKNFASAEGSCMGIISHKRFIEVEFKAHNATRITVTDTSENGQIWRLATPEFNSVELTDVGYNLISPTGDKMKVRVPAEQVRGKITVSQIRYGGSTSQHNSGIGFGNQYWLYNKVIDIPCSGNITVTLELEEKP